MNVFAEIKTLVLDCLAQMQDAGDLPSALDFTPITVEPPRDKLHGDMATNAALVLGKACGQNPRELADKLATRLRDDGRIANIDIAGPGFLNLHLNVRIWHEFLATILRDGKKFGRSNLGKGQKVNVEYVSANPTGPLHVGHARGAIFGDALANLLKFSGYTVTREYYVNDGGAQVDVLARSVYLRYLEANGQEISFPEGTYPGDYLIAAGRALKKTQGNKLVGLPESEWLEQVRDFSVLRMMKLIRADLRALGIKMDHFFYEKTLYDTGQIEAAVNVLKEKGLIYQGTLPPPKGKQLEDWEAREQTLFKSTDYGDDVDRPIQKSDGSWTYFTPDIAYHYDKINRGYDLLIDVLGADHKGYIKRMKAAVSALSDERVVLDAKTVNLVTLLKNGEPFKMSKRAGNFVGLRDLLDRVDVGVVRFTMLTRKNDAPLDFDFEKVLEQSKDNPIYYVQYAHGRTNSVFRRAESDNIDPSLAKDLSVLIDESELELIKKLAEWPRLVELAALYKEPHRIAFYLYELAAMFHSFWNLGKDRPDLRIIHSNHGEHTGARLVLIKSIGIAVSNGLRILGIEPMDEL